MWRKTTKFKMHCGYVLCIVGQLGDFKTSLDSLFSALFGICTSFYQGRMSGVQRTCAAMTCNIYPSKYRHIYIYIYDIQHSCVIAHPTIPYSWLTTDSCTMCLFKSNWIFWTFGLRRYESSHEHLLTKCATSTLGGELKGFSCRGNASRSGQTSAETLHD